MPAEERVRLGSLDAYRGFVMLLLMGEALRLCEVAAARPGSTFWALACHHQSHVPWVGASLHDLIQPSFSFLVGAALPFSLAARATAGQSRGRMIAHAVRRALILVVLGIALRSIGRPQVYFTFEDTLTQIGLGYVPLFLLARRPRRDQWVALAVLLFAHGAAFAAWPLPPPGFDYAAVGVPPDWPHHLGGFAAHWNKNSNLAWAFDTWFLNLFPRERPFTFNSGGYATLSFVPTLGTMILGLLAGEVLRDGRPPAGKVRWLVVTGLVTLAAGWLLGALGLVPVVKRIWTPSFTLWSGGACLLIAAGAYAFVDRRGHRRWVFPLVVIGTNSIAAYCLYEAAARGVRGSLPGLGLVVVLWLVLYFLYRRRLFLRI
jgi:heparan-alpha-glucosaminide N-acetyltransferase